MLSCKAIKMLIASVSSNQWYCFNIRSFNAISLVAPYSVRKVKMILLSPLSQSFEAILMSASMIPNRCSGILSFCTGVGAIRMHSSNLRGFGGSGKSMVYVIWKHPALTINEQCTSFHGICVSYFYRQDSRILVCTIKPVTFAKTHQTTLTHDNESEVHAQAIEGQITETH